MNGASTMASWRRALSFNTICAILAMPAIAMIPLSWYLVEEPRVVTAGGGGGGGAPVKPPPPAAGAKPQPTKLEKGEGGTKGGEASTDDEPVSLDGYWQAALGMLSSAVFFEVVMFQFLSGVVGGIVTTAGAEVQRVWADVQNLQNQLFSIGGHLLFVFGLGLVRARCTCQNCTPHAACTRAHSHVCGTCLARVCRCARATWTRRGDGCSPSPPAPPTCSTCPSPSSPSSTSCATSTSFSTTASKLPSPSLTLLSPSPPSRYFFLADGLIAAIRLR